MSLPFISSYLPELNNISENIQKVVNGNGLLRFNDSLKVVANYDSSKLSHKDAIERICQIRDIILEDENLSLAYVKTLKTFDESISQYNTWYTDYQKQKRNEADEVLKNLYEFDSNEIEAYKLRESEIKQSSQTYSRLIGHLTSNSFGKDFCSNLDRNIVSNLNVSQEFKGEDQLITDLYASANTEFSSIRTLPPRLKKLSLMEDSSDIFKIPYPQHKNKKPLVNFPAMQEVNELCNGALYKTQGITCGTLTESNSTKERLRKKLEERKSVKSIESKQADSVNKLAKDLGNISLTGQDKAKMQDLIKDFEKMDSKRAKDTSSKNTRKSERSKNKSKSKPAIENSISDIQSLAKGQLSVNDSDKDPIPEIASPNSLETIVTPQISEKDQVKIDSSQHTVRIYKSENFADFLKGIRLDDRVRSYLLTPELMLKKHRYRNISKEEQDRTILFKQYPMRITYFNFLKGAKRQMPTLSTGDIIDSFYMLGTITTYNAQNKPLQVYKGYYTDAFDKKKHFHHCFTTNPHVRVEYDFGRDGYILTDDEIVDASFDFPADSSEVEGFIDQTNGNVIVEKDNKAVEYDFQNRIKYQAYYYNKNKS